MIPVVKVLTAGLERETKVVTHQRNAIEQGQGHHTALSSCSAQAKRPPWYSGPSAQ